MTPAAPGRRGDPYAQSHADEVDDGIEQLSLSARGDHVLQGLAHERVQHHDRHEPARPQPPGQSGRHREGDEVADLVQARDTVGTGHARGVQAESLDEEGDEQGEPPEDDDEVETGRSGRGGAGQRVASRAARAAFSTACATALVACGLKTLGMM